MSVFKLTESGDLDRSTGATSYSRVDGLAQCEQHLRTRLRLIRGEVFRDTRIGVDFFGVVTDPGISESTIANHIAAVALGTPGVIECELSFEVESHRGLITIDADAVFSSNDLQERQPFHAIVQINHSGSIES